MTDTPQEESTEGGQRDGGAAGCWRAGEEPPAPPDDASELVDHVGSEAVSSDRCYVLRVALADAADEYALRVVQQLDTEVDVLGTTLTLEVGPEEPGVFDVLVEMEYDPPTVTAALVDPAPVDAVTVVRPDPATTTGVEADDETVSEAVPDVDPGPEDDADAGGADAGGADAGDDAGADDPASTFDELRETTERVGYEELLAELDETPMPGEFREDVDLRPLLEEDDGSPGADAGAAGPGAGPGAASPDAGPVHGDGGRQMAGSPAGAELDPDRVVDALVTAVETDALGEDQRRALSEALDPGPPKTLQVRVDHVQRELDELTAYKDALESFIEEYGTGEGLVQQVREVLEQFTDDVDDLEGEVADLGERVEAVESELSAVREAAEEGDDVADRVATLEEELSTVTDRLSTVEAETGATVDDLADDLAATEERVAELEAWHDRIRTVLAGPAMADQEAGPDGEGAASDDPPARDDVGGGDDGSGDDGGDAA